jgi:hypothetical protein
MKGKKGTYSLAQIGSSVFMILALIWLTVSIPFVYEAAQSAKVETQSGVCDETNPFSNTTEEKNESSVNTLSEYLHDLHLSESGFTVVAKYYKCHPSDLYFEFHPELLSPPPEA